MTTRSPYSAYFGFTIVELLVVIAVIGILAAITLVSYSGITNRATIASIQSDLSNASTALRMDQTTNDSFPATLVLANGGKGITPSQTMDSIIYVPDNTSNHDNFCLQYRKGTNTYAVDASSQPAKGVCLTNLVSNSLFETTVNWNNYYALLSVASNTLTAIGNVTPRTSFTAYQDTTTPVVLNKQCYISAKVRTTSNGVSSIYIVGRGSTSGAIGQRAVATTSNPTKDTWYPVSGVITLNDAGTTGNLEILIYLGASDTNTLTMEVQKVTAIDLTSIFGAGNEPSQAQMDTIMANYPNSWFNIVAKANL